MDNNINNSMLSSTTPGTSDTSNHQISHDSNTSKTGFESRNVSMQSGTADKKESIKHIKKNNSEYEDVVSTNLKERSSNNLMEMVANYKDETKPIAVPVTDTTLGTTAMPQATYLESKPHTSETSSKVCELEKDGCVTSLVGLGVKSKSGIVAEPTISMRNNIYTDHPRTHACQYSSNESNFDNSIDRYTINPIKAKDIYEKLKVDLRAMQSKKTSSTFLELYDRTIHSKRNISEFQIDTTHFTQTHFEKSSSISCEFLNSGSTKTVFKCVFEGQTFALAIPTCIREFKNWPSVFEEIDLTNKLRQLSYPVMPFHKIIPISLHQLTIPAIIMPLFSQLDGTIIDCKNSPPFIDDLFLKRESTEELIQFKEIDSIDDFIDVSQSFLKQSARLIHEKYDVP